MTIAVDMGRKATKQTNKTEFSRQTWHPGICVKFAERAVLIFKEEYGICLSGALKLILGIFFFFWSYGTVSVSK